MASFRGECPAPTGDEGIPLVRLRVKEMARLSGESSGQQGGPDEERNGGVEDVDVLGHDASFDGSVGDPSQIEGHTVALEGVQCQCRAAGT
jgi:hypothetical protein